MKVKVYKGDLMKRKEEMFFMSLLLFLAMLLINAASWGQSSNEVKVERVYPGEIKYQGFTLKSDANVKIMGKGADVYHRDDDMVQYGWILNSRTREVVWHLLDDKEIQRSKRRDEIYDFDKELSLKAGDYEVYFTAMYDNYVDIKGLGDAINMIFSKRSRRGRRYYDRDYEEIGITVSGPSGNFTSNDGNEYIDSNADKAVVSITRVGDRENIQKNFSLKADTKLRVYALGEGRSREVYDYAWIYDADSHTRVWTMDGRRADYGGGGDKNLIIDEEIELPAGNYSVHYVTDGSHSFDDWNVLPPDDPQHWGISIWTVSERGLSNVVPFNEKDANKPVVELIRARDNDYYSQGFKLKKSMDIRIMCFGEGTDRRDMSDYGWIINAETRETVWDMNEFRTEHAGGAEKNRMVDEKIRLEKGDYIAYYATDDSHSYRDWNSSPPYDPERWGITLWAANKNDRKDVELFDEKDFSGGDVLVSIVHVRDHEYERQTFTLEEDTKVRIIAVGEGERSDMFDFGWIENDDTNRIVWEMTYRRTEHAGGARKNRMFNGTIMLPKGEYKAYFETDGSHSWRDWNDSPPYDQDRYGITILKEK